MGFRHKKRKHKRSPRRRPDAALPKRRARETKIVTLDDVFPRPLSAYSVGRLDRAHDRHA